MEELKAQFNRDMNGLYIRAISETKFNPHYFREMLKEFGGLGTSQRLLSKPAASGFTKLWELKRLDLTVEAFIIDHKEKYKKLFTNDELKIARQRLDELGYFKNN